MFIRAENGEYINGDVIVRLRAGVSTKSKDLEVALAVLKDDTVVRLWEDDLDTAAAQLMPVIPATSGYEALWTVSYADDPELGVIRHPVLGWRVDHYGGLRPVTLNEETASNVSFGGVKYPDGRVVTIDTYENEEEWFKQMQEWETRRRASKAVA